MKRVVHVAGARPNFPKLAPVMRAMEERGIAQLLVNTGQHYDDSLVGSFFRDLSLPTPDVDLGVGSGSHAQQTAALLIALEPALIEADPSLVLVYGDVNSTLAAALVASKLGMPVGHVEAGLRSFDVSMPEELNRRLTDALAQLLFVTSHDGVENLAREGVDPGSIHEVGNPMIDTLFRARESLDRVMAASLKADHGDFAVVTLHRPSNVDDEASAEAIVRMLRRVADRIHVVFPIHPRGRLRLEAAGLAEIGGISVMGPQPYPTFMGLVRESRFVLTDSGGVQEETTMLDVPCLTLRPNTERPITITHGTNRLVRTEDVLTCVEEILQSRWTPPVQRPPLWDGRAGERIAEVVARFLHSSSPA